MPGITWPPRDTDRNRFLCRLQVGIYGFVAAYFGLFALVSGALVPWTIFTVALAATLVVVVALVLMRAQRQAAEQPADRPTEQPRQQPAPGDPLRR
jgi:membrane protein implicated in regulation of membrane protease activity